MGINLYNNKTKNYNYNETSSPNNNSSITKKNIYSPKVTNFNKNYELGKLSPIFSKQKDIISISSNSKGSNFLNVQNNDKKNSKINNSNYKSKENDKFSTENSNENINLNFNDYNDIYNNSKFLINQIPSGNLYSDFFSQCMYEYINQVRNNPKSFIQT